MKTLNCGTTLSNRGATKLRGVILGLALVLSVLVGAGSAVAAPAHRILSDEVLRDSDSMTPAQIQAYLNRQPGPLKRLVTSDYDTTITVSSKRRNVNLTPDTDGVKKPASLIIWEACQRWNINPKVMLTMLQKEQSLLTRRSLTSTTLARAIGAGCPNSTTNKYPGFGNQMWHGARLLNGYGEADGFPDRVTYINAFYPGITYLDIYRRPKVVIHPYSIATYKLYVYNPSIAGNTNFWNIYRSQFGNPLWPAAIKSTSARISGPARMRAKRKVVYTGRVSRRSMAGRGSPSIGAWVAAGRRPVRRASGLRTVYTATPSSPPRRASGDSPPGSAGPKRRRSATWRPRPLPRWSRSSSGRSG